MGDTISFNYFRGKLLVRDPDFSRGGIKSLSRNRKP